ncbi:MAG: cytochrome c biogenesis protein CcsA [Acidobacteriia bacterium]|nr:cytochrome c biogenesis protein CcsA [Terriglobia bacterium]
MNTKLYSVCVVATFALLSYGAYWGLVKAPEEATMGDAQRIFYIHVPAAAAGFTLFFINFIASVIYLWKRSKKADAWALTTAEVGVVFCTVVLITGPIWARYAWGKWWVWDMRLTTTLLLWLLYIAYMTLRRASEAASSAVLAAALAIFAFLDVPIVYMANRWFRTNHPQPVIGTGNLDPQMGHALMINMFAFLAFAGLIAWFRYELERAEQAVASLHLQKETRRTAMAMALPALLLFQAPHRPSPTTYMYAGYIAAWVIYISYLLLLIRKVGRLKREGMELLGK